MTAGNPRDTIFALSSGRPPAAIAIIRISGSEAHEAARAIAGELPPPRTAAVRELRDPESGQLLDEALVVSFDGPGSATGEDSVELHCHGGRAVVAAVLASLAARAGLREALPGEFTRRAFDHGRIDLTEAEGLADLIEAETESQRRAALKLADGSLKRQIDSWRQQVLALSARAEQAIDYVGEDEAEAAGPAIAADAKALAEELSGWLDRPRAERLKDGIRVVAAGPPNSGKSSLINAIAGEARILVSDVEGTTRDVIEVPLGLGGLPFLFTDTAGLRDTEDRVEAMGVNRASAEVARADVLLWLGDPEQMPDHPCAIRVHARADVRGRAPDGSIAVSALTGDGLGELVEAIVAMARPILSGDDQIALNDRQARLIDEARVELGDVAAGEDPVIQAEGLRRARFAFERLTGRAGVEDLLDALFARFCLGK
jgi:tRNA modification GTPase